MFDKNIELEEAGNQDIIFFLVNWVLQDYIVNVCFIYLENKPLYYISNWKF